jgi:hypothetical protein
MAFRAPNKIRQRSEGHGRMERIFSQCSREFGLPSIYVHCNTVAQCSKTVITPLKNIQRTRAIEGYSFYENLRPNQQLDVIGYKVLVKNLLKTFIFRVFSCYLPNRMKNFTLSRLFFYLYLASKGDQNTFYLFQSSN